MSFKGTVVLTIACATGVTLVLLLPQIYGIALLFYTVGFVLCIVSLRATLALAAVILVFLPGDVQILLTGVSYVQPTGGLNLHVLTYYIFGAASGGLMSRRDALKAMLGRDKWLVSQLKLFAFLTIYEVTVELSNIRGTRITNHFVDVYLGPIVFYFLFLLMASYGEDSISRFENWCLVLFVPLIGLSVVEFFVQRNPIWHSTLVDQCPWYVDFQLSQANGDPHRVTTTLGHPLTNAVYFLVFSLLAFSRWKQHKSQDGAGTHFLVLSLLLLVSLFLTLSRSALVLWLLGMFNINTVYSHDANLGKRVLKSLALAFVVGILFYPLLGNVLARGFVEDSSVNLRVESLNILSSEWQKISLFGYGPSRYEEVKEGIFGFVSSSNFEIGWMILLIQYGAVFFILYAAGALSPVRMGFRLSELPSAPKLKSYAIIVIVVLVMFTTNNSIGERSTVNYLFFLCLGLLSGSVLRANQRYLEVVL